MAYQMVYTSVRSGLVAGRSGFCTAARHREIKESLVARLEDFSAQYDRGVAIGGELPVIYQHRIVTIRENRYHVLMRLADAGNDYTGRTNHIAHSLVLEPAEVAGLSLTPAEAILALAQRGFWRSRYDEPARFFGSQDTIDLSTLPRSASLPAVRWFERSGAAANAAQLFDSGGPTEVGVVVSGNGENAGLELLTLFAESLLLLGSDRSAPDALWSVPFTTLLQSTSERSHFRWCGIVQGTNLETQESRSGRRIITLGSPMTPPNTIFSDLAEGRQPRNAPNPRQELETLTSRPKIEPGHTVPAQHNPATAADRNTTIPQESGTPTGYYVPISLDDPKRAKRGAKRNAKPARTAVLIASGVVLLATAVALGVWLSKKDVWAEEARIGILVTEDRWDQVNDAFNNSRNKSVWDRSEKLSRWRSAANAISRFEKIASNPNDFNNVVRGKRNIDEALQTIEDEWKKTKVHETDPSLASIVDLKKKSATDQAKSFERAKKLKITIEQLRSLLAELSGGNLDFVSQQTGKLAEKLKLLDDDLSSGDSESTESAKITLAIIENTILPCLSELKEIDRIYGHNEKLDGPAERAKEASRKLESSRNSLRSNDSNEPKLAQLNKSVEAILTSLSIRFDTLARDGKFRRKAVPIDLKTPTTPNPNLAQQEKTPPPLKREPLLKTYLTMVSADDHVDLTTSELSDRKINAFQLRPIEDLYSTSKAGGIEVTASLRNFYDKKNKSKPLFTSTTSSSKLKIETGNSTINKFPDYFVFRFPDSQFQIVAFRSRDSSPNQNQPSPTYRVNLPSNEVLSVSPDGNFSMKEEFTSSLKIIPPPEGSNISFQLHLKIFGDSREVINSALPSDFRFDYKNVIASQIEILNQEIQFKKESEIGKNVFTENHKNLGRKLFPSFFKVHDNGDWVTERSSGVGTKYKVTRIGKPYTPEKPKELRETFSIRPGKSPDSEFKEYVRSLFTVLCSISGSSQGISKARPFIDDYIFNFQDHQAENKHGIDPVAFGWIRLSELSKQDWPGANLAVSTRGRPEDPTGKEFANESEAREAIKIYKQSLYFFDFFEAWEHLEWENLDKKSAELFFRAINDPVETKPTDSLEILQNKLLVAQQRLERLKELDLDKDCEFALNIIYRRKDPEPGAVKEFIFPFLKSPAPRN